MFRTPPELGELLTVAVTAPGAGNNFSYTLPGGYIYKLDFVEFLLSTDATVTNRTIMLNINAVASRTSFYSCFILVSASLNVSVHLWAGLNIVDRSSFNHIIGSLPSQIYLPSPTKIESAIFNLQASDTLTNIFLCFRVWAIH